MLGSELVWESVIWLRNFEASSAGLQFTHSLSRVQLYKTADRCPNGLVAIRAQFESEYMLPLVTGNLETSCVVSETVYGKGCPPSQKIYIVQVENSPDLRKPGQWRSERSALPELGHLSRNDSDLHSFMINYPMGVRKPDPTQLDQRPGTKLLGDQRTE